MAKISINLLPIEFREQQAKKAKFYKIQTIGVVIILSMVFLSSLTVSLRILQSQNILRIQKRVAQAEEKVSSFKNTQGSLILLKDRLITINQYLGNPSQQSQMYKLIGELQPTAISVSSISVGKAGDIIMSAITKDSSALDDFISDMISKDKNQDKISQVSLETISRGRDGIYRLSFSIKANK